MTRARRGGADLRSRSVQKLLVANRGEIALRVFRTCRELGIATVAVAAPDDRGSLHARSADETVEIASYLDAAEHVRAARETGADAVHPGYGFLAESADLAEAVESAGLTWVGPPVEALRLGGDKLAAKRIAREAGVPVVPDGRPPRSASRSWSRPRREEAAAACASSAPKQSSGRRSPPLGARRRPRSATARCSSSATSSGRDTSRSSCSRTTGNGARARRARVLDPAAAPEGAGGVALPRARPGPPRGDERRRDGLRAGDRLSRSRHGRVRARRPGVLLPGAERAHPGRASGHRGRHGRRPRSRAAADRRGRAGRGGPPCAGRERSRRRGAALRGGPAHVPAAGRPDRTAASAGGRPRRRGRRRGRRDRHWRTTR